MAPCNNSSNEPAQPHQESLIGASILAMLGLPGNVLVIILISQAKEKKSTTTYLLLSLAIADILHLLGVDIVAILVFLVDDHRMRNNNKTLWLMSITGELVANFTLALIALERHSALVETTKLFVDFTRKRILGGVFVSWLIGLVLSMSIILYDTLVVDKKCLSTEWPFHVFWSFLLLLGYAIPLVVQLRCYASVIKGLYFDRKILGQVATNDESLSEKKRLVRILVVINLVFLACNIPAIIILALKHVRGPSESKGLYEAMLILGCLSSLLNPFLYGLQSEKYRSQVRGLFCAEKQEDGEKQEVAKKQEDEEKQEDGEKQEDAVAAETGRSSSDVFDTKL